MQSQLKTYQDNIADVRGVLASVQSGLDNSLKATKLAKRVVDLLERIDKDADKLEKIAGGLEAAIKLVGKIPIAPLKTVADLLVPLIDSIQDRAEEVRNATGEIKSKFTPVKNNLNLLENVLEAQIEICRRSD